MDRRSILKGAAALALLALPARGIGAGHGQDRPDPADDRPAVADRQADRGGVKLYMAQNGDTVAGKKIEVILKDDGAVPDNTKRLAQELIVNDKVGVVAGFGVTPAALAVAPLATEAKVVEVVMAAGTSIITERSPYIVRTSFTLPQSSVTIADWAAKNGIKKVVTHGVRLRARARTPRSRSRSSFTAAGGEVVGSHQACRCANPDFAPFLQRAADAKPDAIFVFVPSGQGGTFMKQYAERGLDKAGIKLIGPGDVTDDDLLQRHGRRGDRRRHRASLLGRSPLGEEQGVRRGLQEGQQLPAELHVGRRLRRHAPDLRGAEEDRRQGRRRQR